MTETKKRQPTIAPGEKQHGFAAFIPIIVFLVLYLGSGLVLQARGVEDPFKQVSREISLVVGIVVGLLMGQRSFKDKVKSFSEKAANPGIIQMILIFIAAGILSGVTKKLGSVDSLINLGLTYIPQQFLVPGIFLISAVVATASGTSVGTVSIMGPIAVELSATLGHNPAIGMAAVIGGGLFGDNLSIISDTTIAATRGAGAEMKDKFKMNFRIALPAAIITMIIYALLTGEGSSSIQLQSSYDYSLIKILPYIFVIVFAIIGFDVLIVLLAGSFLTGIIGLLTNSMGLLEFCKAATEGIQGMESLILFVILIKGLVGIMEDLGGIDWLLDKFENRINSKKGALYFVALFIAILAFTTSNNTIAIIITAPILKPIVEEYNISPQRYSSVMDIFSCIVPGLSPIGTNVQLGLEFAGLDSPIPLMKHQVYLIVLFVIAILTIQFELFQTKDEKAGVKFYE